MVHSCEHPPQISQKTGHHCCHGPLDLKSTIRERFFDVPSDHPARRRTSPPQFGAESMASRWLICIDVFPLGDRLMQNSSHSATTTARMKASKSG